MSRSFFILFPVLILHVSNYRRLPGSKQKKNVIHFEIKQGEIMPLSLKQNTGTDTTDCRSVYIITSRRPVPITDSIQLYIINSHTCKTLLKIHVTRALRRLLQSLVFVWNHTLADQCDSWYILTSQCDSWQLWPKKAIHRNGRIEIDNTSNRVCISVISNKTEHWDSGKTRLSTNYLWHPDKCQILLGNIFATYRSSTYQYLNEPDFDPSRLLKVKSNGTQVWWCH